MLKMCMMTTSARGGAEMTGRRLGADDNCVGKKLQDGRIFLSESQQLIRARLGDDNGLHLLEVNTCFQLS